MKKMKKMIKMKKFKLQKLTLFDGNYFLYLLFRQA